MSAMKSLILIAWVALAVVAVIAAGSTAGNVALWIMGALVLAHLVEMVVFFKRCQGAGGSMAIHMVNVFLFGVFHIKELPTPGATG